MLMGMAAASGRRNAYPVICPRKELPRRGWSCRTGHDPNSFFVNGGNVHSRMHQHGKLKTERLVPVDSFVCRLVERLRLLRSQDPLPADGFLLARPSGPQLSAVQSVAQSAPTGAI
jgi:hypothetical protein